MIWMGYIVILDSQSVRAGKGLMERDFPQHVHVLGIQFLYDGIMQLWTHIFHMRPHSMAILIFIGKKISFGKVGVATYFILF